MRYLELAIGKALDLGAEYADIRVQKTSDEVVMLRNLSLKNTSHNVIYGYGTRVFYQGAWGFAHNNVFSEKAVLATTEKAFEIAKLSASVNIDKKLRLAPERSYIAKYETPLTIDPIEVPLSEKLELRMETNRILLGCEGNSQARCCLISHKYE